ncbi:Small-conductance mechanosensitive channel [bacterium HR10]|nr:Small-conductance mechanosensitive channel [bacterium HR10]
MPTFLLPYIFIGGGLLAGVITERLVLNWLRRWAERTTWKLDEVLIDALRGVAFLLLTLLGLHLALVYWRLPPPYERILSKAIVALALLIGTVALMRFLSGVVIHYASRYVLVPATTSAFQTIVRVSIFVVGLMVIFQTLGVNVTPILTALGVGGLAIALALQDTLANLFAGLHILAVRQIRPGDFVRLESGEEGYVGDIGWRNTTIRTLTNNLVIIPNTKLAGAIVTNYSLPESETAVLVQVGVSYDSDLEWVERVTREVARDVLRTVPGGVPDFEPLIRYQTFGDSSIQFTVVLRGRTYPDQHLLRHEFIKRLHQRYREEGIEIPFPIRTLYVREAAPILKRDPGGDERLGASDRPS